MKETLQRISALLCAALLCVALLCSTLLLVPPRAAMASPAQPGLVDAMRDAVQFEQLHGLEGLQLPEGMLYYTQPLLVNTTGGDEYDKMSYRLVVQQGSLACALELEAPHFGYDPSGGAPYVRLDGAATRLLQPVFDSGEAFALVALDGGIYLKTSSALVKMREADGSYSAAQYAEAAIQPLQSYTHYSKAVLATYELGIGMQSGWQDNNGSRYYFDQGARQRLTGWQKIDGSWYYFDANEGGRLRTGIFRDGSGLLYLTDRAGAMLSNGWAQSGDGWYHLAPSGAAAESRWKAVGGSWYWFGADGRMATGWQRIGKWYYFKNSGAMYTGWLSSGGKWYYFKADGSMAAGGRLSIGGKSYTFDSSGVWIS